MAGRVVTVASPLPLVLDGLPGGTEVLVELERSVDLVDVTGATLQVAVKQCAVATSGVPGFFVEVRPIEVDPGQAQDALGDPVATVAVDDFATGKLLWAPLSSGFGGSVQVTVRCGQAATGSLSLVAYVSLVCKWRESRPIALRRALRRLARLRRRGEIVSLGRLAADDALLPVMPSLISVAQLRSRVSEAQRSQRETNASGSNGMPCGRRPRGAVDGTGTGPSEQAVPSSSRSPGALSPPERRAVPPVSESSTTAGARGLHADPRAYPTEIEIVAVSRGPTRGVVGPFRTRGRCVPSPDSSGGSVGPAGTAGSMPCRCGLRHVPRSTAHSGLLFDVAIPESVAAMSPTSDDRPQRRAAVFLDDATPWIGGRIELPAVGVVLEVVPEMLSGLGPGAYDLELTLLTGECRGKVRSGGLIVLHPLVEANTSNVVGPVSLDGLVHGTSHPEALTPEVKIQGKLFLPAQGGTIRPGPIVIVGHGVVDNCLPEPELPNAVLGVTPLLARLAANGFIAAAIEGVASSSGALAALGLLRWLELPIEHPLELGQLPPECGLVGHSQAATGFPAVASYINRVANSSESLDYFLNPIVAADDGGDDLHVPDLVEFARARAISVVSFAPPYHPIENTPDDSLEADFNYWLVISGAHDGDVSGPNALQVFDRFGSRAPAKPPGIQASVRVRRLNHGSWFDFDALPPDPLLGGLGCDPNAVPELPSLGSEGTELLRRMVTMWLLGVMLRSRHRAFFEIRNLVGVSDGDALQYAEQAQWRFTLLPWRFFDPTTDTWFVQAHGSDAASYSPSNVNVTEGVLSEIVASERDSYHVGHIRTRGLLLEWPAGDEAAAIVFPAQDEITDASGLVLQITGAVPPDGVPEPTDALTFRVGLRGAAGTSWVDLADYGGWRVPDGVAGINQVAGTLTTAVLSTISVPVSDFAGVVVAGKLQAVEFDLASRHAEGRFFLAAVAITGWKGETLA